MKGLLNSKTQRVKRRQLPPSRKVIGWAQVALMMWMVSWGSPLLEYIAAGSGLDRLHKVQPRAIAAGESSGRERVNIQGPDLSGIYGGMQGTGGTEAVYNQTTKATTTMVSDTYGHAEGTCINGSGVFVWNTNLFDGYGTLPSSSASVPLTSANDLASVLGWRGHVIDPTGYYYLGARYYAPDSGSFLSPDPLGHAASWDLYSFCNGDPVNNFDPDGRFGVGAAQGVALGGFGSYSNPTQAAGGLVGQIGSYFVPGLDGYALARDVAYSGYSASTATYNIAQNGLNAGNGAAFAMSAVGLIPGAGAARSEVNAVVNGLEDAGKTITLEALPAAETTGRELATSPWPANRGFIEGTVERKFLMPGETIDRYGFGGGKFVSPTGTPLDMRALRPGTESLPYNNYRVVKPFEVNSGGVAPAFNQRGLGTQYELPVSIDILMKRGIIEKVP